MSQLDELIQKHCPDGVEYRKLEDCCTVLDKKGNPLQKQQEKQANIPIMVQTAFRIMFQIIFLMARLFLSEKMEA